MKKVRIKVRIVTVRTDRRTQSAQVAPWTNSARSMTSLWETNNYV